MSAFIPDQNYPGGVYKQLADFAASSQKNPTTELVKMAWVGDSITAAQKASNSGNNVFNSNRSQAFWVPFLTGQRILCPQSLNFGVSGDTTTNVLARMDPILACGAGYFHVMIGVNDSGNLSQTLTNLKSIWDQLLATGAVVLASTVLPRTTAVQATRDYICSINSYIRSKQGYASNFFVIDPFNAYGDPLSTTFSPRTNYSYDGLHPKALGAYYISLPVRDLVNALIPDRGGPCYANSLDNYSGGNLSGSLNTNSILDGTAGTKSAAGSTLTGDVADDWTISVSTNGGTVSNLVTTASKVTVSDGRPGQRIVMSGDVTPAVSGAIDNGTLIQLTQDVATPSNVHGGDTLRAQCEVDIAEGTEGIAVVELKLSVTLDGTTYTSADGAGNPGDLLPSDAFSGTLRTPDLVLPSGNTVTLVRTQVRILFKSGTSVTVVFDGTITGVAVRKVTS